MCRVLEVGKSGFYASVNREPSARAVARVKLLEEIRNAHAASRRIYGSPRVFEDLKERGIKGSENTIAKVMKEEGIRSKIVRKFKPQTTDSKHAHPVAGNVLDRDFKASAPDQKWVADITPVETDEGWLYVAGVLDLYSRKLVGWSMAGHMRSSLVEDALKMAVARRQPPAGLLHHSDQGSQYACGAYRTLLAANGLICSMSRTGNCYDNAAMESFWGTLKTEHVFHERYATMQQARQSIFEYIEVFYNRQRRHSSIGYVSPEAFEAALN